MPTSHTFLCSLSSLSQVFEFVHIGKLLSAVWEIWSRWYSNKLSFQSHCCLLRERCCFFFFFHSGKACLCLPEESWVQKWVMLGINAAIFVKEIKPPNLQGQFMPIMSRAESFLCDLIIASRPQFFVNNTPVYAVGAHLIHNLFCSHSRLEWKGKKSSISPFHPLLLNEENHFQNCGAQNTHRSNNRLLCNTHSSIAIILNSIHHCVVCFVTFSLWWSSFFFFSQVPLRNTLIMFLEKWQSTRLPTVADKIKLDLRFPWVSLRCPPGAAPGFISLW